MKKQVEDEYHFVVVRESALLVTFQGQRLASRDKWAIS